MSKPKTEYLNKELAAKHTGLSVRRLLELSHRGSIRKRYTYDPKSRRRIAIFLREDLDKVNQLRPGYPSSSAVTVTKDDVRRLSLPKSLIPQKNLSDHGDNLVLGGSPPKYLRKQAKPTKVGAATEKSLIEQVAAFLVNARSNQEAIAAAPAPAAWLTLAEAETFIGLPEAFLAAQIRAGKLAALDVGVRPGGRWRVSKRDLEAIAGERHPATV